MLIREALKLLKPVRFSKSRKVALVCSFEPLHLKTYVQAFLVQKFPDEIPEVVTFGYDQLQAGLSKTSTVFKICLTLLCLSWEDIHPSLTWRTRGHLGDLDADEVLKQGERLKRVLAEWIESRNGAETYIVIPSVDFLPLHDACSPLALGQITLAASSIMWGIAQELSTLGGRVLRLPPFDVNYRDLLYSGCPLSPECSEFIARGFIDLAFRQIQSKKAIVTDLDGTLWMGIIGEEGPSGIVCGPEGRGYPFYVFQKFLVKLKREGVLLAFCSKNNPNDVLPWFDALDMPLKLSDFAAYRCNWKPKSGNIISIAKELNIGGDALVVVDDDQAELAEIQHRVQGVSLFRIPRDGREWMRMISNLQDLFSRWRVSEEDRIRTESFTSERQKNARKGKDRREEDPDETTHELTHLCDMDLEVTLNNDAFQDPRSLELINKTNQFNLTGERFAQDQWLAWASMPGAFCLSASLRDRFGDFGTICVVTGHRNEGTTVYVRQFVLSCRAFGRGVENIVLGCLVKQGPTEWVRGAFKRTGRNEPAEQFLAGLGCDVGSGVGWRVSREILLSASQAVLKQTNARVRTAGASG